MSGEVRVQDRIAQREERLAYRKITYRLLKLLKVMACVVIQGIKCPRKEGK